MINENVTDSAEATQQQHLVPHRALVYIQWIGGGPVGAHTHTQAADKEGLEGKFVAVSLILSPPTIAAALSCTLLLKVFFFFCAQHQVNGNMN